MRQHFKCGVLEPDIKLDYIPIREHGFVGGVTPSCDQEFQPELESNTVVESQLVFAVIESLAEVPISLMR